MTYLDLQNSTPTLTYQQKRDIEQLVRDHVGNMILNMDVGDVRTDSLHSGDLELTRAHIRETLDNMSKVMLVRARHCVSTDRRTHAG